ncbi:hypothetical protein CF15_04660 [Pyrodictium occultum]|uniref:NADH-quinone oxidoreductase subunit J n=1 Tax=Pyrodictium occultum TaxID=2309 RepID=A0A0V8RVI6_PYROC|nr:NADH-quinone oxidoreductase subunit J [Pyrodictium occultum]KSW12073.1 hypothetical protein CF15_04660 [Pyrodictium occultum]
MSVQASLLDAAIVVSLLAAASGSVGAIMARKTVHSIAWLVIASLGVAAVLALTGYGYLSVFHIVVYTGAGIMLLAIVVMMLGCGVEPRTLNPGRLVLAFFAAAALEAPLAMYALSHPVSSSELASRSLSFTQAARVLMDCWLCTLLMVVTVAAVLIEALSMARGSAAPRGE